MMLPFFIWIVDIFGNFDASLTYIVLRREVEEKSLNPYRYALLSPLYVIFFKNKGSNSKLYSVTLFTIKTLEFLDVFMLEMENGIVAIRKPLLMLYILV
jgi:hypothetical protein